MVRNQIQRLAAIGGMFAAGLAFAGAVQAETPFDLATGGGSAPQKVGEQVGTAAWYGEDFDGRTTADGERFDMYSISAAHPTLPLRSWVEVTNLENGRHLMVRVNDRRPTAGGAVIVLSKAAAANLGVMQSANAKVSVRYVQTADDGGAVVADAGDLTQTNRR